MNLRRHSVRLAVTASLAALLAAPALAQQVTGTLGSPSATTTIPNSQLPAPDPRFGGVIKNDALQSKAWWAPHVGHTHHRQHRHQLFAPHQRVVLLHVGHHQPHLGPHLHADRGQDHLGVLAHEVLVDGAVRAG